MPFNRTNAIAFTAPNIRSAVPNSPGVYGIFHGGAWIYVGESEHLRGRLLEHVADAAHEMHSHSPTHFVYEVCLERGPRHRQLTRECAPCVNTRIAAAHPHA